MSFVLPPMFAGLEPEDQDQARSMLQPCSFEIGEEVMLQGEEDTSIAFVSKGGVEILVDDTHVGMAGVRDVVGEMELFTALPRLASIRTTQQTELLVLAASAPPATRSRRGPRLCCDAGARQAEVAPPPARRCRAIPAARPPRPARATCRARRVRPA